MKHLQVYLRHLNQSKMYNDCYYFVIYLFIGISPYILSYHFGFFYKTYFLTDNVYTLFVCDNDHLPQCYIGGMPWTLYMLSLTSLMYNVYYYGLKYEGTWSNIYMFTILNIIYLWIYFSGTIGYTIVEPTLTRFVPPDLKKCEYIEKLNIYTEKCAVSSILLIPAIVIGCLFIITIAHYSILYYQDLRYQLEKAKMEIIKINA